jgi:hypothetical protein
MLPVFANVKLEESNKNSKLLFFNGVIFLFYAREIIY